VLRVLFRNARSPLKLDQNFVPRPIHDIGALGELYNVRITHARPPQTYICKTTLKFLSRQDVCRRVGAL
jgi:hypothetical protein